MDDEEWRPIEFNNTYHISNKGQVKNSKTNRILKNANKKNYYTITLRNSESKQEKHFFIHRLVATHFIPNPENKPTVNHIDRDTKNNNVNNLEWNTLSEQQFHRYSTEESIEFGYGHQKKTIYRLDKNNNDILEEYPSITLAIKWLYNNNYTNYSQFNENTLASLRSKILEQIKGKRNTVYGFKWKYAEDIIENEEWREINPNIVNNSKGYFASSYGRIKTPKGKISNIDVRTYATVNINNKTYYLHRIIAETFIPNTENKSVAIHIDGNKLNNNMNNLKWATQSESSHKIPHDPCITSTASLAISAGETG